MLFDNAHAPVGRGIYAFDLVTYEIDLVAVADSATFEVAGKKRNEVYYATSDWILHATNLDTHVTRKLAQLQPDTGGFSVDAGEKFLLGTHNQDLATYQKMYPNGLDWQYQYDDAKLPSQIITIDIDSGAVKTIHDENQWLDHAQFSPTDPDLLMYYHEGPWDRFDPDRIWVAHRTGDFAAHSLRTIIMGNGLGHEFWSPDGTRIFYDYQRWDVPTPPAYFFSSTTADGATNVDVALQPDQWGYHYNISHDGTLVASDGGVTRTQILLYRIAPDNSSVTVEPLADLTGNDTNAHQPNVQFTPDGRWVVFSSAQTGTTEVYAVSVD